MKVFIRRTIQDDLSAVDAMLAATYPRLLKSDYPPSVLVTALPLISRANPKLLGSGTYYVAEAADGTIVGAGGWTPDRTVRHLGHIRHLVTDHRVLRQGVGRALMTHALATAGARGVSEMECWSTRTAVPFYQALGFTDMGPMEVSLRPGIVFPSVRMRLSLSVC